MIDVLFVNVPIISVSYPPTACSMLKSVAEQDGYSAKVIDFNLSMYEKYGSEYDDFFIIGDEGKNADHIVDEWVDEILDLNPRFLGISVFTFQCQTATRMLCAALKKKNWEGKIIIGGAGISSNGISAADNDFGKDLLENGTIDYYVRGEGELSILKILSSEEGFGINNDKWQQIDDLDCYPFPNYGDIIDLPYKYPTEGIQLPISGSRGCVRKCTFCDIHTFWKKFRFRSGESIAAEMIHQYETHNVRNFFFTDSLINGSMKAFRDMLSALVDYYEANGLPDRFFNFGGQYIIRSEKQQPSEDYELMARAGCNNVVFGVETGSEDVRNDMKKMFDDKDLDFAMEQFSENNLTCYFSMISGYPTETIEDHEQTKKMFKKYQRYIFDGTIIGINLGGTMSIDDGTPIFDEGKFVQIINTDKVGLNWYNPDNPALTLDERVRRRIDIQEYVMKLGYTVWSGDMHLKRVIGGYERIKNGTY